MDTLDLIKLIFTTRSNSKLINATFDYDPFGQKINKKLSYLKKKGFIQQDDGGIWNVTESGGNYYKTHTKYKYFDSKFTKKSRRNMLIIFDIPETERSKRDWLRYQIKQFHYIQIQQSVWHGPSPLPKDFINYLKEIEIRDCLKIFKSEQI